ncbi:hypothetical protein IFR04_001785 [Cadophora malorum]|uniref:Uncharacterized protein n=1 Tax=Cadophora malorum TaxID=108018 RepID=A0A8H8BUX3_9HELO|nr:hypothetical protein IFR04_001785 [Cadophora malorum]
MSRDQQAKSASSPPLYSIQAPDPQVEEYSLSAFLEDSRVPALARWQHIAFRDPQPGPPQSIPTFDEAPEAPRVSLPQGDIAQFDSHPTGRSTTKPRPVAPQSIPIFTEARQAPRFQLPETDLRQVSFPAVEAQPRKERPEHRFRLRPLFLAHSISVFVEDRRRPQVNFPENDLRQLAASEVDAEDLIEDFAEYNVLPPTGKRKSQVFEHGRGSNKKQRKS